MNKEVVGFSSVNENELMNVDGGVELVLGMVPVIVCFCAATCNIYS